MQPKATDYASADEFVAADAKWLAEQGIEADEDRAENARRHFEASHKASLRRSGVRIPGEKCQAFPKFTGIKFRYGRAG